MDHEHCSVVYLHLVVIKIGFLVGMDEARCIMAALGKLKITLLLIL